jgi:hypothetical protein
VTPDSHPLRGEECKFLGAQFGFCLGRCASCSRLSRAWQSVAIQTVLSLLRQGYTDVVDADLSKYFDTIPHDELMQSLARVRG